MQIKGQVISGEFGNILVRQKQSSPIEIGELLIGEGFASKVLLQAVNLTYGSQISQQNRELVSGMFLEENQDPTFFEANLRNYTLAQLKTLLTISYDETKSAKTLPEFFSTVREIQSSDLTFLPTKGLLVGYLRSGSKQMEVPIYLDAKQIISHHILVPATTGKGKSNLMSVLLWNLLSEKDVAMLIFDPHDEYFGKHQLGLSKHLLWQEQGVYFSTTNVPSGGFTLAIHLTDIKPKHFMGVSELSEAQSELMQMYYAKYGEHWIESLLTDQKVDHGFHDGTISVVKRRLCRLLSLDVKDGVVNASSVYSTSAGKNTISDIIKYAKAGKKIIVDTSFVSGQSEILISSIITSAVFDSYKYARKIGESNPVVGVVLEEAPRVLGKEVLERGTNIFSTIAKEGRKFNVGICAITQLPSLIPKDILANMNTKIILGLEMAPERTAVIESAAQDLSDDDRNIASLDKGEALITSNFTRFAIPIKIPLLSSIVTQTQIDIGKKAHSVKLAGLK